ncbi:Zn(II)2Cys6 transcription factor domain-containing protein [Aspergillus saccharolyticus JOP 1030-1]|uniref:Zn(2)-C6 fungal-type domain-containing protein n=1 Tax=Aspergillus saccharolyticus JOP 1030-1 TaxID=1450539 RepID=A0A318Z9M5_9EURO|nr:hypothetical protein BP01DRAFT_327675 [Aspergillus saccharolyticus JOP 1030-1]PYH41413.1 hypothetical protein BP01DRAFT_327675 [Aspergillus saccharolyticus JOP 1030-1]
MAPSKVNKASRITVACNSCRFRKQKCNGNKPICTQCHQHNRRCDWPEQLKRGPAKGYIEALEHRLQETESLLLKFLSHMSDAQISSSMQETQSDIHAGMATTRSPPPSYTPSSRSGKRGTEYWKQFPLNTVQDVRAWQQDCLSQEQRTVSGRNSTDRAITSVSDILNSRNSEPLPETSHELDDYRTTAAPRAELPPLTPYRGNVYTKPHEVNEPVKEPIIRLENHGETYKERDVEPHPGPMFSAIQLPRISCSQSDHMRGHGLSTPQTPSLWRGAPSVSFQQQYLW